MGITTMMKIRGQRSSRGVAIALGATFLMAAAVVNASAEEQNFFSSIFGGEQPQAPAQPQAEGQPQSAPRYHFQRSSRHAVELPAMTHTRYASRPLTVKLHRPKVIREASVTRVAQAPQVPTRPEKVSIFNDKTLRRGDAVMTRHGMRIFAGSNNWPYRDNDFVALADAGRLDKGIQTTLISLDRLPRN